METSQLDPKLSLQPFDPEVFQRVWNRVMPDQSRSPIAMDAPSQPAVPALSPAPEQPPETPPEVPLTCLGEGSRPYTQAIRDMGLPEADYFMKEFLPSYGLTIEEQDYTREAGLKFAESSQMVFSKVLQSAQPKRKRRS